MVRRACRLTYKATWSETAPQGHTLSRLDPSHMAHQRCRGDDGPRRVRSRPQSTKEMRSVGRVGAPCYARVDPKQLVVPNPAQP